MNPPRSTSGPPRRVAATGRLGPFRHRPFALYWAGGLLSNLGTWLQAVAGSIFVYQLTGSPVAVGILNFLGFLPVLLFSVAGGVISDRFDRRRIVIWTHILAGLLATGLAVVTLTGSVTELHIYVVAFALNTTYAIAKPALVAILPGLVPRDEISDAVGLNTLQFILGQVIGPTIAALAMATAGAGWAFAINAFTYLGPIVSMVYLQRRGLGANLERPARGAPTGPETAAPRVAEGRSAGAAAASATSAASATTFIRQQTWVLALLAGVVACSAPLEVIRTLSPALAAQGLGAPESSAGLIVAAQAIGSALALLVFVPLRRRGWAERMVTFGYGLQALGLVATAFAPGLAVAVVGVALVGFGFSLCFPVLTGILQTEVPDGLRGRVMAFHQMSHMGNRPFVALTVGFLAGAFGAQHAVLAAVVLTPFGLVATRRAWTRLAARSEGRWDA